MSARFTQAVNSWVDGQTALRFVRNIERLGMGLKLQGLAGKIDKLQHDAEHEAEKLDAKVEEVSAKLPTVFSGAHRSLDGLAAQIGDVEKLVDSIKAVTNGGPPMEEPVIPPPPIPDIVAPDTLKPGPPISYP